MIWFTLAVFSKEFITLATALFVSLEARIIGGLLFFSKALCTQREAMILCKKVVLPVPGGPVTERTSPFLISKNLYQLND